MLFAHTRKMSLHDGVHLIEAVMVVFFAAVALSIGWYLYKDEKDKIAAIRKKKALEGKLG